MNFKTHSKQREYPYYILHLNTKQNVLWFESKKKKKPCDLIVVKLVLFLRFDYNGFWVTFVVYICIKTPFPVHFVHVWLISPKKKKKSDFFISLKKKIGSTQKLFFLGLRSGPSLKTSTRNGLEAWFLVL